MTLSRPARPWYREPWPWLLMAGPAVVIVAAAVTIWLAVSTEDGLVADDYYKRGLAINQTLQRDRVATARGYRAQLAIDADAASVRIQLRSEGAAALPPALRLRLAHPTRSGQDQTVVMQAGGAGYYLARISPLGAGRWIVIVEDPEATWRLVGALTVPQEHETQLVAGPPAG